MKKLICILTAFFLIIPECVIFAKANSSVEGISAQAYCLMIADNSQIIASKNEDIQLPMASTTKIMTAITVIENTELERIAKIPKAACNIEGSSAYLYENESISVKDLLYALMLNSANDAATALAIITSGSVEAFVELMNEKANELALHNTHFTNPHGLDDDEHYSSARDLALIMTYAMSNEIFREITSTYRYITQSGSTERLFINHNRLLKSYEGCIGGKTGFTKRCGRCLVSVTEKDGMTLIAVTLNAPNDWNDHKLLHDYGHNGYEKLSLVSDEQYVFDVHIINGETDTLRAEALPLEIIISKNSCRHLRIVCELDNFYYAKVQKGEILGHLVFLSEGKEIARSEIKAQKSVKSIKYKNLWQKILSLFIKD